jgi:hypothetical protein
MKAIQILTVILAFVLIFSVAIILFKEDVFTQEYKPASYLSIREVDVKPIEVTSALVELNITAYINHEGGKTKNASMLVRAINSDTGLLETQVSTPIPETHQTDSEKTLTVSQNIEIQRIGGYELKLLIFDAGSIVDSGSVNIQGLTTLTPQSKRSGLLLNNIDFTASNVSKGFVTIKSDIYFENKGSEASENLKMIIKAKQADSNLIADKTSSETEVIPSEATTVKSVQLVVPDEYNYMVVVELWRGDVLINTWEKPVLLAPTKTIPKESEEKNMNIEVSKFVRDEGASAYLPSETSIPYPTATKEPGFEAFTAIVALILLIALRKRL